MRYKIKSHKNFRKQIRKLPRLRQAEIYRTLKNLASYPDRLPSNIKALKEARGVYRVRFGDYRLIIFLDHKKELILVLAVGSRGEVYRMIKQLLG